MKMPKNGENWAVRNDSSIPQTKLKIPMPTGAKAPPPAPAKPSERKTKQG